MNNVDQIADLFNQSFGAKPTHIAIAPGRINLIGEHIDYCDGFVLPMAIERGVAIAFRQTTSARATVFSQWLPGQAVHISLAEKPLPGEPKWSNYLRGVLHEFYLRELWPVPGFDALVVSNLPVGAGLASSAALELAVATMVESLLDQKLSGLEKARLCQSAELNFVGVPCGIMDQLASALGEGDQFLLIDCRQLRTEFIPFDSRHFAIVIANTGVAHDLTDGRYALRRGQTIEALGVLQHNSWRDVSPQDVATRRGELGDELFRRARHIVTEMTRTQIAAKALVDKQMVLVGQQMNESHESLKVHFEVSSAELDTMVSIARSMGDGVLGSRMTGAGFGGSTVTLAKKSAVDEIIRQMQRQYLQETGIHPAIFESRPAAGARLLELDS